MKKYLSFVIVMIFAAQYSYAAQKQNGTFTCRSRLSLPLSSFYLELQASNATGTPAASFVTVTTDVTQF